MFMFNSNLAYFTFDKLKCKNQGIANISMIYIYNNISNISYTDIKGRVQAFGSFRYNYF